MALVQAHQVVAAATLVLHQSQIRFVPGVPVPAGGQAHAAEPALIMVLPQIPHVQLVPHPVHRAIVDGAQRVRIAWGTGLQHPGGGSARRGMPLQFEFHTVLVGEAVVVEREQYQASMTNVGTAVFDAHLGNLLEPPRPFLSTATPRCRTAGRHHHGCSVRTPRTWKEESPGHLEGRRTRAFGHSPCSRAVAVVAHTGFEPVSPP